MNFLCHSGIDRRRHKKFMETGEVLDKARSVGKGELENNVDDYRLYKLRAMVLI